jgi:hypothetical protein
MEKPLTRDEIKNQNKKQKFNVYEHFSTMAEKSTSMLQQFIETNVLLRKMDARIGHLIDKLYVT